MALGTSGNFNGILYEETLDESLTSSLKQLRVMSVSMALILHLLGMLKFCLNFAWSQKHESQGLVNDIYDAIKWN